MKDSVYSQPFSFSSNFNVTIAQTSVQVGLSFRNETSSFNAEYTRCKREKPELQFFKIWTCSDYWGLTVQKKPFVIKSDGQRRLTYIVVLLANILIPHSHLQRFLGQLWLGYVITELLKIRPKKDKIHFKFYCTTTGTLKSPDLIVFWIQCPFLHWRLEFWLLVFVRFYISARKIGMRSHRQMTKSTIEFPQRQLALRAYNLTYGSEYPLESMAASPAQRTTRMRNCCFCELNRKFSRIRPRSLGSGSSSFSSWNQFNEEDSVKAQWQIWTENGKQLKQPIYLKILRNQSEIHAQFACAPAGRWNSSSGAAWEFWAGLSFLQWSHIQMYLHPELTNARSSSYNHLRWSHNRSGFHSSQGSVSWAWFSCVAWKTANKMHQIG